MTRPLLVSLKLNFFSGPRDQSIHFHFHMKITHEVDRREDYPLGGWREQHTEQ